MVFIVTVILGVLYAREAGKQTGGEQTGKQEVPLGEGVQSIGDQGPAEQVGETEESNFSLKQESIVAKSTGVIKEIVLSEDQQANSPMKIDTLKISFNDGTGKQTSIDIAVQIIPEKIGSNIIPWFVEGAYKDKFGTTPLGQTLSVGDLKELFNEGSTWVFIPLLKSNLTEGTQTYDAYLKYLSLYYTDEEWNYLEEARKNKFNNFNFPKPILISRLFYDISLNSQ